MDDQGIFCEYLINKSGSSYKELSRNSNITFDVVEKYIDKPLVWSIFKSKYNV